MINKWNTRIAAVILIVFLQEIAITESSHPRQFKARTRFLATSTCIRGTWGFNLDVYLAEIVPHHKAEPVLVQLIDEYRNLDPPLAYEALTSPSGTTLRIRRDRQCDMPYAQIQLRTAPGDPTAILFERLGYQPQLPKTPEPHELIPCYRIAR